MLIDKANCKYRI